MYDPYKTKRSLICVTNGRVIPLAQLSGELRSYGSSGFAVLPPIWAGTFAERLFPNEVGIHSPADGVVTNLGSELTLRTGDGISISVIAGTDVRYICKVGDKIRAGEMICILPRAKLLGNGSGGAVAVALTDLRRITELHVVSGTKKAGQRTAFYKLRPFDSI